MMMVGEEDFIIFVTDSPTPNPSQVPTNAPTSAPAISSPMMISSLLLSDFIPFDFLPTTTKKKYKNKKNQFAGKFPISSGLRGNGNDDTDGSGSGRNSRRNRRIGSGLLQEGSGR
mmetsp:Transcript_52977/g.59237  ORF Transcript_52977/g.59237 Transcript_52977/m.59237 type:complete len:115 (+) Transcript_52977:1-345(+)